MYKNLLARDHVYDFLAGLNSNLDKVRGRLSSLKHVPSIEEAFAEVRREESQRRVMMGTSCDSKADNSGLVVKADPRVNKKSGQAWCDHCTLPYHHHTLENIWERNQVTS